MRHDIYSNGLGAAYLMANDEFDESNRFCAIT